jgi:hypothetical protein
MKQVYYRYLDCLNRNCLLYISLGALPSPLYDLFVPPDFQAPYGLNDVLLQVVPGWGKQLLRTGKDSLALHRHCRYRKSVWRHLVSGLLEDVMVRMRLHHRSGPSFLMGELPDPRKSSRVYYWPDYPVLVTPGTP